MEGVQAFEANPKWEIGSLFRVQSECSDGERDVKRGQPSSGVIFSPNQAWELLNRNGQARLSSTSWGHLSQLMLRTHCRSAKLRERLEEALGATYFEDLFILAVVS